MSQQQKSRFKLHHQLGAGAVEYVLVLVIVVTLVIGISGVISTPLTKYVTQSVDCISGFLSGSGCAGESANEATTSNTSTTSASDTTTQLSKQSSRTEDIAVANNLGSPGGVGGGSSGIGNTSIDPGDSFLSNNGAGDKLNSNQQSAGLSQQQGSLASNNTSGSGLFASSTSSNTVNGSLFNASMKSPNAQLTANPSQDIASNCGPNLCAGGAGNPIDVTTGNKYQYEVDLSYAATLPLSWARHYISMDSRTVGAMGHKWRHSYETKIKFVQDKPEYRVIIQADGRKIRFKRHDVKGYKAEFARSGELYETSKGEYRWTWFSGRELFFNKEGQLQTISDNESMISLHYDSDGKLHNVNDQHGRTLQISYNNNRISHVRGSDGQEINYRYDSLNNLIQANYLDGLGKRYRYDDSDYPHHLTGIDNLSPSSSPQVYANYAYDNKGRGILSERAGGVTRVKLAYAKNYTDVENAAGLQVRHHWIQRSSGLRTVNRLEILMCDECRGIESQQFYYDEDLNVTRIEYANGRIRDFHYDNQGRMINVVDSNDEKQTRDIAHYVYHDNDYRVDEIKKPSVISGQTAITKLNYTAQGLINEISEQGYTPTNDNANAVIKRSSRLSYNQQGQLIEIDGPREDISDITRLTYDQQGYLQKIDQAGQYQIQILAVDLVGRVLRFQQGNNEPYRLKYNEHGQLIEAHQGGVWQKYQYAQGRVVKQSDSVGRSINYRYDDAGNIIRISDGRGRGMSLKHDLSGNITAQNKLGLGGVSQQGIRFIYDRLGRVIEQQSDIRPKLSYSYDQEGNLNAVKEKDSNVLLQQLGWTAWGELSQIKTIGEVLTRFSYNKQGSLTMVTDANENKTHYLYDDFGRVVKVSHPDYGHEFYVYDESSNVTKKYDIEGLVQTNHYNALNQLIEIESKDTTRVKFYYKANKLAAMESWHSVQMVNRESYHYDGHGRLFSREVELAGHLLKTIYRYSDKGALIEKTLADGRAIQYRYSTYGEINKIELVNKNGKRVSLIEDYNSESDTAYRQTLKYPDGTQEIQQYDKLGRPIQHQFGDSLVVDYSYDHYNQIASKSIRRSNADSDPQGQRYRYTYDNQLRLTTSQFNDKITQYQYDGVDNRLYQFSKGKHTQYGYPQKGHGNLLIDETSQTSKVSYAYNEQGSVVEKLGVDGKVEYYYNDQQRLKAVYKNDQIIAQYEYNGWGERVKKVAYSGAKGKRTQKITYYLYEGGRITAEIDDAGSVQTQYVYLGLRPIAKLRPDAYYPIYSELNGTPQQMVDASGKVVWSASYDAYGKATIINQIQTLNLRYAGQYFDANTGLHYNYHRYYDANTGRYLTVDPIGLSGGLNQYTYANSNPINFIDPLGLCGEKPSEAGIDGFNYDWRAELALDVGGLFEPTPFADVTNGSLLIADGRYFDGAMTYLGAIPVVGDVAGKGAKYAFRGGKWAIVNAGGKIIKAGQWVGNKSKGAADWLSKKLGGMFGAKPKNQANQNVNADVDSEFRVNDAEDFRKQTGAKGPKLLPTPRESLLNSVIDPKLKRRIDALYRKNATVGNGSTADAIRYELKTGELLSPSGHSIKGIEMRNGLLKDIKSGRLNPTDTKIARGLLKDLQNALSGQ